MGKNPFSNFTGTLKPKNDCWWEIPYRIDYSRPNTPMHDPMSPCLSPLCCNILITKYGNLISYQNISLKILRFILHWTVIYAIAYSWGVYPKRQRYEILSLPAREKYFYSELATATIGSMGKPEILTGRLEKKWIWRWKFKNEKTPRRYN